MKNIVCLLMLYTLIGCHSSITEDVISPRFNHVYLNSSDVDKSIAFYQAAFDVEVFKDIKKITRIDSIGQANTSSTHIVLLRFPGQNFNLEIGNTPNFLPDNSKSSYAHLGIDVEDIETASQRLINAGATPIRPIGTVQANDITAKTAFFTGPNGEVLELMQLIEGEF